MNAHRVRRVLTTAIVLVLAIATDVSAQVGTESLGRQDLRAYTHVFIAYAIAWLLIAGWVVSIGRKLGALTGDAADGPTEGKGD